MIAILASKILSKLIYNHNSFSLITYQASNYIIENSSLVASVSETMLGNKDNSFQFNS